MISVELWRARIGLFNSKRYSGFLSSLFSSYVPFKFHRRRKRNSIIVDTQETPPTAAQSPASINTSTTSIRAAAAEEPSTVSSFQQYFLSFSWTSLLPTSFPRGCLLREALVRLVLLIAIVSQALIISGDVETNPGPLACE